MNIKKPTLILNENRARKNIEKIAERAKKSGVVFRPHFKTHISSEIGEWFRDSGVEAITVSSVDMAEYFANNGWNDITIAFPVNILQIDEINSLAGKVNLNLLVEDSEVVTFLDKHLENPVNIWVKIDTGYHRAGVKWDNFARVISVAKHAEISNVLNFEGLLVHTGHTYKARSKEEVKNIYYDALDKLVQIREHLSLADVKNVKFSVGDTPSCSMLDKFTGVHEVRPGNFVFYDVQQNKIGSCSTDEIAVAMACPVVAKHKERNEILVYGGAVHLSTDFVEAGNASRSCGLVAFQTEDDFGAPLKNTYVKSVSQEHGIIKTDSSTFDKINIGDILMIYPAHSCLAADLMGEYLTLDGRKITTMHSLQKEKEGSLV